MTPEEHELEDLNFFKRVDKMLLDAGKPHLADILQLDKLADLDHPDLTPIQALLTSIGTTAAGDWGLKPAEVVGSMNSLMELLKGASKQVEGLYGTSHDPLAKLKALFGGGKT